MSATTGLATPTVSRAKRFRWWPASSLAATRFNAMTTDRPYRAALPQEKALGELAKNSGTQFDPAVVEALIGTIAAAKRAPSSSP
jgi:hypothetical protein